MNCFPWNHHKDDKEFIKKQIAMLPTHWRKQVVEVYSEKYKETLYSEPNKNKRENLARKAANGWLRGYVEKYKRCYLQNGGNDR